MISMFWHIYLAYLEYIKHWSMQVETWIYWYINKMNNVEISFKIYPMSSYMFQIFIWVSKVRMILLERKWTIRRRKYPDALDKHVFQVMKHILNSNIKLWSEWIVPLAISENQPWVLFTNPSARAGYDTRSIFKRSLTGLNSEFSFS